MFPHPADKVKNDYNSPTDEGCVYVLIAVLLIVVAVTAAAILKPIFQPDIPKPLPTVDSSLICMIGDTPQYLYRSQGEVTYVRKDGATVTLKYQNENVVSESVSPTHNCKAS